jgi:hypothetical protein
LEKYGQNHGTGDYKANYERFHDVWYLTACITDFNFIYMSVTVCAYVKIIWVGAGDHTLSHYNTCYSTPCEQWCSLSKDFLEQKYHV